MTDRPTCPIVGCGRPIHDQAYVCTRCSSDLARRFTSLVPLAGEAAITIARLAHVASDSAAPQEPEPWEKNPGALFPTPLPVLLAVAADHDSAVNTLTTWARHVHEESGRPLPTVQRSEHPFAVLVTWLASQTEWLRHRPEAAEAFDELTDACRLAERVVDRLPERAIIGSCVCGQVLYALRGRDEVTCESCGTAYDVQAAREQLREDLGAAIFTASEIAVLATYLGIGGSREQVRKLINQWHVRGRLAVHDYGGQAAFRFDEVIARLAEVAA